MKTSIFRVKGISFRASYPDDLTVTIHLANLILIRHLCGGELPETNQDIYSVYIRNGVDWYGNITEYDREQLGMISAEEVGGATVKIGLRELRELLRIAKTAKEYVHSDETEHAICAASRAIAGYSF